MKKILSILSAITIVSTATSSIISCSEPDNHHYSSYKEQTHISEEMEENSVFTLLENGIDAEFLTTQNTGLDAESLIQDEALKNDLSITDLTITDDVEQNLNKGENEFNIELVINDKSSKLKTKIKNVKSGELTNNEIEEEAETLIEQDAEIPLHSSTDNTAIADAIEDRLHEIGEKDAEVEIVHQSDTQENEISYSKKLAFASTTQNNSAWVLKVSKLNNPSKSTITKPLTLKKLDTSKLDQADASKKEDIAFTEITKLLNDSSFDSYKILSTANTFKEACNVSKEIADAYAENLKDLKTSCKLSNEKDLLKVNNNKFQLTFQFQNKAARTIDVELNNITNAKDDHKLTSSVIKKEFEKGISAPHLYGWNTIFDALNYFQAEATKINKNAYVKLSKDFINKKQNLKKWKSEISNQLKKADKSVSSIPVDIIVDMAVYSPHLIHKVLSNANQTALNPILASIKNHSDFYLTGAKEEAIDLEISYENPFNSKKASKNKHSKISEDKKIKTEKIKGKIKGVNPRNKENAKKIIEKETLTVNEKVTFGQAVKSFKEYISDTLFFSKTGKHAFEFTTELKVKKQEKEALKSGINKIKCIIKPSKTSTVFKGNLELTIKVNFVSKSNSHKKNPIKNNKKTPTKNNKKNPAKTKKTNPKNNSKK